MPDDTALRLLAADVRRRMTARGHVPVPGFTTTGHALQVACERCTGLGMHTPESGFTGAASALECPKPEESRAPLAVALGEMRRRMTDLGHRPQGAHVRGGEGAVVTLACANCGKKAAYALFTGLCGDASVFACRAPGGGTAAPQAAPATVRLPELPERYVPPEPVEPPWLIARCDQLEWFYVAWSTQTGEPTWYGDHDAARAFGYSEERLHRAGLHGTSHHLGVLEWGAGVAVGMLGVVSRPALRPYALLRLASLHSADPAEALLLHRAALDLVEPFADWLDEEHTVEEHRAALRTYAEAENARLFRAESAGDAA